MLEFIFKSLLFKFAVKWCPAQSEQFGGDPPGAVCLFQRRNIRSLFSAFFARAKITVKVGLSPPVPKLFQKNLSGAGISPNKFCQIPPLSGHAGLTTFKGLE